MDNYTATEEAYKNGYEKGKQDAMKQCAVTREKLIELVRDARGNAAWHNAPNPAEYVADFLIANGVTLDNQVSSSKWIPVTERLPGVLEDCLVAVKMKYDWKEEYTYVVDFGYYAGKAGNIDEFYTQDDFDEGRQYIHVTHWMPLPQAPKEG